MIPKTFEAAFTEITAPANRFAANEAAYLSPKYQEAEIENN